MIPSCRFSIHQCLHHWLEDGRFGTPFYKKVGARPTRFVVLRNKVLDSFHWPRFYDAGCKVPDQLASGVVVVNPGDVN